MKSLLTAEESAKLIELGVSPERASEIKVEVKEPSRGCPNIYCSEVKHPIFTLADILDILPKEIEVDSPNADKGIDIEDCYLCTQWCMNGDYADNHQWCAFYTPGFQLIGDCTAPELIDALYSLLLWCLEKGYVKLD